jgi:hypothetical protein
MYKLAYAIAAGTMLTFGAEAVQAQGDGALVAREFGCFMPGRLSGLPIDLFTDQKTHIVVTPSGNIKVTCHFIIPEGFEPQVAINRAGWPCTTSVGNSLNSKSVATPGGKLNASCQIKGNN